MRRYLSLIGLMTPVLLVATVAACGARRPLPPVDTSQDARIRAEVESRLAAEPALRSSGIRVEVVGRMVILHGAVQGLAAWKCAIANADLVGGVTSVTDYLVLVPGEREIVCLAPRPATGTIVDEG